MICDFENSHGFCWKQTGGREQQGGSAASPYVVGNNAGAALSYMTEVEHETHKTRQTLKNHFVPLEVI